MKQNVSKMQSYCKTGFAQRNLLLFYYTITSYSFFQYFYIFKTFVSDLYNSIYSLIVSIIESYFVLCYHTIVKHKKEVSISNMKFWEVEDIIKAARDKEYPNALLEEFDL